MERRKFFDNRQIGSCKTPEPFLPKLPPYPGRDRNQKENRKLLKLPNIESTPKKNSSQLSLVKANKQHTRKEGRSRTNQNKQTKKVGTVNQKV